MRRTDFCHLTSSYEHPRLVGSWRRKLALACPGIRLLHGRAIHFGGAPALAGARASGTLSPLLRGAEATGRSASVNRCASERRPGVPSVGQGPSPRDALSSARLRPPRRRGFATATPAIDAVGPARAFLGSCGPSPRPRVPLPAGGALLWARDIACRLLQPYTTRGHTRRASDPRARAGLSLRCSPAGVPAALACPMRFNRIGRPASHDPCGPWVGASE